jgi:hypothetical protein
VHHVRFDDSQLASIERIVFSSVFVNLTVVLNFRLELTGHIPGDIVETNRNSGEGDES